MSNDDSSQLDGDVDRPDPEDDPYRCSMCGQPLGTFDRVEGEDYCDACKREYLGEHVF